MSLFHTIRYHSRDQPLWYWETLLHEQAEPEDVLITGPKQGILHVWAT